MADVGHADYRSSRTPPVRESDTENSNAQNFQQEGLRNPFPKIIMPSPSHQGYTSWYSKTWALSRAWKSYLHGSRHPPFDHIPQMHSYPTKDTREVHEHVNRFPNQEMEFLRSMIVPAARLSPTSWCVKDETC